MADRSRYIPDPLKPLVPRVSVRGAAQEAAARRAPGGRSMRRWATTPDSVQAWGWYVEGRRVADVDLDLATERAKQGEGFVWLGLKDPTDEDMASFARRFDLHPLAIEDAVEGHSRSKLEQFGETLFLVISTVAYIDHEVQAESPESSEIVSTGQIMVFVGENFVMTVRRGENTPLFQLRAELETDPQELSIGPSYVLYKVLDRVVDDYMRVVTDFDTDIDEAEVEIFDQKGVREIDRVYNLKRELIEFKRAVVPLGAPLTALSTRSYPAIPADSRAYFREVADHHTDAREAILSFDEVLSTLLQAGLARVSVADNQDMRQMSAALAILAVPTTIGAVYGMNFENMPETRQPHAYFVVLGIMLVLMLGCYAYFHKRRWL